MRFRLAWVLFVLGVVAAGCGGGGKSGIVPSLGPNGGPGSNTPTTAKTTHATISFYVPPANKQASRKPLYISPNTQAFGVLVLPYVTPLPSPVPTAGIQIFPVTTPSPCAAASGGGLTCTFNVTAPVGTDVFIVAAFASTSPPPNAGPLSAYVSGPIAVSLSPSPGASPLGFTLNGVVNSVAVNVVATPTPPTVEPPNTDIFTVGVPTSAPIAITAYDSSGNAIMSDATTPYYNPIVIQVSPAPQTTPNGLTLSLVSSSACGSIASGGTAQINCAGDLDNVQVTYDGTPRPDASDHLLDAYSVYSTTAPNPTPSPANFVLASNIENATLAPSAGLMSSGLLLRNPTSGQFVYMVDTTIGWEFGTFDPATSVSTSPVQMTTASSIMSAAVAPNGDVWVDDNGPLDCYTPGNGSAVVSGLYPVVQGSGDAIYPTAITIDSAGNLWYAGYDNVTTPQMYAGYFNVSQGCISTIPSPITEQFTLGGDTADYNPTMTALPSGGVAMATGTYYASGVYVMQTTSASSLIPPVLSPQPFSYGITGDNAGNVYVGFQFSSGGGLPDIEKLAAGSSTLSTLLADPPAPSPPPFPQPEPSGGLTAFSASGAADRMIYADSGYAALGVVESVASSPMPILVGLPNAASVYGAAFNKNGGEYALNSDGVGNLNLTRLLPTRTWSVANLSIGTRCNTTLALLTVLERGDSGPFTVSIPPANGTATQFPGADHDFLLSLTLGGSFAATVTDAHGRTETFNVTTTGSSFCGLAHRPAVHHRP